ncbi:MAG: hypothetical protein ACM3N0_03350 [Chloroflexota bacterium]
MAPWKLPLIVAALAIPVVAGFFVGGAGVGVAMGALAALAVILVAIAQRPRGPIAPAAASDDARHVLIVAASPVEDPDDVARVVGELGLADSGREVEVRVLVPARIGFLDRWASDVESARRAAQQKLVATVAALAKAGVAAEARVGDEDIVQAVEDQLQSYPATEVLLVGEGGDGEDEAAAELRSRLEAEFRRLRLDGAG